MYFKKSLKPYIINAFYTWAIDLGLTPLIEVIFNPNQKIPSYFYTNNQILLNIHPDATRNLVFGKDTIEFQAKFNSETIEVSISHNDIFRIANKEDGYSMDFELEIPDNIKKNLKPKLTIIKNENNS